MRSIPYFLVGFILASTACGRDNRHPLVGQVLAVDTNHQEITIKHEDVRGFMPGMTMPFKVVDASELTKAKPGDLITATLVVKDDRGYVENIVKTGEAPLPEGAVKPPAARMIEPGAAVADAEFTDQDGRTQRLSDWRGKVAAVTFIYTRCPLPDFCPMMDRKFTEIQKSLQADPRLASRVHLFSVSFDPAHDTPPVLQAHAQRIGADPKVWSYLTGKGQEVDKFAAQFGVSIMREDGTMAEIIHNLRTAVIDENGKLVKILNGNDWQPQQLLDEIRAADGRR